MSLRIAGLALLLLCPRLTVAAEQPPPFERTENRERCANYTATRQPFFGELHLHTAYSADAATLATRNTPFDAYRYARGEKVGLPPFVDTRTVKVSDAQPATGGVSAFPYCLPPDTCQYTATRVIQLPKGRALDFAAITDHSEWLGETNICFFEGNVSCTEASDCDTGQTCDKSLGGKSGTCVPEGYSSEICILARQSANRLEGGPGAMAFIALVMQSEPKRFPYCLEGERKVEGGTCTYQAKNVWQQIIAAAEQNYDRTTACKFTSFIAYEYTGMPMMKQCIQSSRPCFADADCGEKDQCAQRGQCSQPYGKTCYVVNGTTSGCDSSGTCVVDSGGNNLHRNIIFRNANVPAAPISYLDVPTGCGAGEDCLKYKGTHAYRMSAGAFSTKAGIGLASPTVMLKTLRQQCNKSDPKHPCEFLSNPHNPNVSGGAMFLMPESAEDAQVRGELERLVEIFQIKGGSECRASKRYPDAWQTGAFVPDELCDFENMSWAKLTGAYLVEPSPEAIPPSSYVRNVLKDGMLYQQQHGGAVNPFKLGFVGGLDSHNGTPGASDAVQYAKTAGHGDNSFVVSGQALDDANFLGLQTNGGGLTAVWAEENSRDSIFAGMHRRETYATSGTRPVVRFFGGFGLPEGMCAKGDFASQGYAAGVPMGGTLTPSGSKAPRFAVYALMDPGWEEQPGASLQRAQIVKGWVDAQGNVHEKVYDVAGTTTKAPLDLKTCRPDVKAGSSELCTVWTDPEFDPNRYAFYYTRVVENPSCRWNQYYCLSRQVDCAKPPEPNKSIVGYTEYEYQQCCSGEVPKEVQQRAWSSPIWYVPVSGTPAGQQ